MGALKIFDGNEYKPVGVTINQNGVEMVKLWENASPTSAFEAQTIPLDLSGYDFVFVEGFTANSNNQGAAILVPVGHQGTMLTAVIGKYYFTAGRYAYITAAGVEFSNTSIWGWNDGGSILRETNNSYCVPRFIYGIKGAK